MESFGEQGSGLEGPGASALFQPKTGGMTEEQLKKLHEEAREEAWEGVREEDKVEDDPETIKYDKAKGCILGALCGDAIGAVLEFHGSKITDKKAQNALTMPGGGAHGVGKGQITDDGELTMCLLHALAGSKGKLDNKQIAFFYAKWIKSKPFDIGMTCRKALFRADIKNPNPDRVKAEAAKSDSSQSNGSLMRATPLAVFCHNMKLPQPDLLSEEPESEDAQEPLFDWSEHKKCVFEAVSQDATFTHSNKNVIFVESLYVYMLTLIINGLPLYKINELICTEVTNSENEEVQKWVEESQEDELKKMSKQMGWMKHAFVCCMRYLRLAIDEPILDSSFYEKSMVEILKGGGDTDTNACIAGGVLGAIVGYKNLPEGPRKAVLKWPVGRGDGIKRDDFLKPSKHFEMLVKKLYDLAPEDLDVS